MSSSADPVLAAIVDYNRGECLASHQSSSPTSRPRASSAVGQGRFDNPDAAIRAGLEIVLERPSDTSIAEAYRRAYTERPQDTRLGEVGRASWLRSSALTSKL